jgi:hypothetical protein
MDTAFLLPPLSVPPNPALGGRRKDGHAPFVPGVPVAKGLSPSEQLLHPEDLVC